MSYKFQDVFLSYEISEYYKLLPVRNHIPEFEELENIYFRKMKAKEMAKSFL